MTLYGTVDLGGIDLGSLDTFGDRMALARVLGGRAVKRAGRWIMQGGTIDGVPLDHPTVTRLLGEPLTPEPGTLRYEPGREPEARWDDLAPDEDSAEPDSGPMDATWTPGPLLLTWFELLTDEDEAEAAAALIDSHMTGRDTADVLGAAMADMRRRVGALILADARDWEAEIQILNPVAVSESEKPAPVARPVPALPTFTPADIALTVSGLPFRLILAADGALTVTQGARAWGGRLDRRGVIHGAAAWGLEGRALLEVRAAALGLTGGKVAA